MSSTKEKPTLFEKIKRSGKYLFEIAAEAVYPKALSCINCHDELSKEEEKYYSLCVRCAKKLPFRTGKVCNICGEDIKDGIICNDCQKFPRHYIKIHTLFDYNGVAKKIVLDYKLYGSSFLYEYIAKFLTDYYKASDIEADYIVFVPSTKKGINEKGFDHMLKLAEPFSKNVNIPLAFPLIRIKESFKTKKHTKEERYKNIEGAFMKNQEAIDLSGKRILLLDDVITTGATVSECSKVLKNECKIKEVIILAFAHR